MPGKTDGLLVRQIVGRFLEHARVYAFGVDTDLVYLSSADMMTRNTEHRVEIAYPVLDDKCRSLVMQYVNLQLADNVKARELTSEGTWKKVYREPGEPSINSQELLITVAEMRAEAEGDQLAPMTPASRIFPDLTVDQLRRMSAIPSVELIDITADDDEEAETAPAELAPVEEAPAEEAPAPVEEVVADEPQAEVEPAAEPVAADLQEDAVEVPEAEAEVEAAEEAE